VSPSTGARACGVALVLSVPIVVSAQAAGVDSAGLRIIDHRSARPAVAFMVGAAPTIRIAPETRPRVASPTITAVRRLADGRIAVGVSFGIRAVPDSLRGRRDSAAILSSLPPRLMVQYLVYDTAGALISRVGSDIGFTRTQFSSQITMVGALPTDTIVARLGGLYSNVLLSPDGGKGLDFQIGRYTLQGVFPDGSFLLTMRKPGVTPVRYPAPGATASSLDSMSFARYWSNDQTLSALPMPGAVPVILPPNGGIVTLSNGGMSTSNAIVGGPAAGQLAPWPVTTFPWTGVVGPAVWVFDPLAWHMVLYGSASMPLVVRLPVPTPNAGKRFGPPVARGAWYELLVLTGADECLWIEASTNPPRTVTTAPRDWWIVARDGSLRGSAQTPPGFRPYHIGPTWIAGTQRDSAGRSSVAVYELIPRR
jgi:hypothetical protein